MMNGRIRRLAGAGLVLVAAAVLPLRAGQQEGAGITEGPIAIQVHGAQRWVPGGLWRWRVIAVKELPT
jgi:hypothetical protein